MDEDELFKIVRNAYNEVNTDYLKSQVLAAVAEIGLTRQEVMDGLLDWIIVGGCTGANDRYRPYIYGALALLREQEPRVMTLEEIQERAETVDPDPVFVEWKSGATAWVLYTIDNIYYMAKRPYMDIRVWTSRPSEQQMRDTPWEVTDNG